MELWIVITIIVFLPVAIYLQEQTYRATHGRATVAEDARGIVSHLKAKIRRWRERGRRRKLEEELKRNFNERNKTKDYGESNKFQ